jgi:hypothetical protein
MTFFPMLTSINKLGRTIGIGFVRVKAAEPKIFFDNYRLFKSHRKVMLCATLCSGSSCRSLDIWMAEALRSHGRQAE